MTEVIDEPVEVMVAYKQNGKKAIPTMMSWQNRLYKFTTFGYLHPVRQGRRLIHVFTMADGNLTYRLEFDSESLNWILKEVSDGLPS